MSEYRSGWAYGDRGVWRTAPHAGELSRYLTILGSAHRKPELFGSREEAEAALDKRPGLRSAQHMNMVVAHVTEVPHPGVSGRGFAYPITGAFDSETA